MNKADSRYDHLQALAEGFSEAVNRRAVDHPSQALYRVLYVIELTQPVDQPQGSKRTTMLSEPGLFV
jgi:proline racemase